ncbi:hypothetical protein WJX84_011046 [Apatococcus fuscideae]|uniref:Hemimethylated DNA-binding domain-containing protein n=1 Tax=Apatococcus fuscideae TaxID=2026836 RepID=A0AAW1SNP8_9CHLO
MSAQTAKLLQSLHHREIAPALRRRASWAQLPGQARPVSRRQTLDRRQLTACQASSAESSESSPSSDPDFLLILELETQLKQRQAHIDELVVAERYKEAAVERDRMDTLRLRLRSINVQQNQARIARILYEPGQVFIHRHYKYKAVIARVDAKCEASELWIKTMKVDGLPDGRDQPFYHSLVDTDSQPLGQTTYVAQANIVPAVPPPRIKHPLLDQLFNGFSEEMQIYIPRAELRKLFEEL